MMADWVSFVQIGKPANPSWVPYKPSNTTLMYLTPSSILSAQLYTNSHCDFWGTTIVYNYE